MLAAVQIKQINLAVARESEYFMNERRFNAAGAQRLDDPARIVWLSPVDVLKAICVHSGEIIADVGAGTGYFSLPLAHAVGPSGKVYAVDAQQEMLALLQQKLKETTLFNVELIHAEADSTGLPASSCDLFFLANVWHEFDDHAAVLKESARVLKPGGHVALLDWRTDVEPVAGPPLGHRRHSSHAAESLYSAGFQSVETISVGLYSWLVQAERMR
ncbi:MAG: class I SAM-dependent methyltransferase [Acidobacteriaceae bacterium]|nr:class I SAM-dependent methyltransferase [Acidobacteriaceae bacterium]